MSSYNIILQTNESTVVAEYQSSYTKLKNFQSEADLEKEFIEILKDQKYEYLNITSEEDLIKNLRLKLEELNDFKFSDSEWERFFKESIVGKNEGIKEKTKRIQTDEIQNLKLDSGKTKNIRLIEKRNIHDNKLQVINQYVQTECKYTTRYDVTILVNGLPLVHVELKRRGVMIKEAFNQINRYHKESFGSGSGLFDYIHIFVISNGTNTKYYSNSTRSNHIKEFNLSNKVKKEKTSNSFEFTSFWADAQNKTIPDLVDFTKTFFSKHVILNILTKYCVFTAEERLLVMRPYQIVATERILGKIQISNNYKNYGQENSGGYIWHTTGSGKTLTSFKTAQLATKLPYIDKVLFVVDRTDLDYQTMVEYEKFQEGAANSNTSTEILKRQLENSNDKIIITTIQKLNCFINKNKNNEALKKQCVIIFDECHRSQFGNMHKAITKAFKNYYLFGFTGTPIFAKNSTNGKFDLRTTEQSFGDKLHTYTIVDAINDNNVLPFRVDYLKTFDKDDNIIDKKIVDIDKESVYMAPERISKVTEYILNNFNRKTYRNYQNYSFLKVTNINDVIASNNKEKEEKQKVNLNGFNSMFCVSSIELAKKYYLEFKKQMENSDTKLKIAIIYSYAANEEECENLLDDEDSEDTSNLDKSSREFLDFAIDDYNKIFKTAYDTSSQNFQNYYKDISLRMKNREIDLLIVVNMFLTGFDATTLNTLWVDKNLKFHGLIQSFSRTNRILNSIKNFGNVICFRNLQKETDDAISLFGDKNATGIVILKSFKDYYNGYTDKNGKHVDGYETLINLLLNKFSLNEPSIVGEKNKKEFIDLFGAILRFRNILSSFDDFAGKEILSEREMQDYQGRYCDLYIEIKQKNEKNDKENVTDDIVFEIELIKQIEINIDYILELVKKYHSSSCADKEILLTITKAINSSLELRSKKDLIEDFIKKVNTNNDITDNWKSFIDDEKEKQLLNIIKEENLNETNTKKYMADSFSIGFFKTTGTDISAVLPPLPRFGSNIRSETKKKVIARLQAYFDKFIDL